ncbi:NrsF family protein [Siccirubricoccus phaeus]|uniref:NrsF family protein n=1 Tax=Siccirubricoccus phaeus TaxID=2595053 RepID=UPI0011F145EC|nr:NrsF family protein [Siccirubricoccus phaeus]
MRSEDLIGRLSADLTPVRPMAAPGWQALLWLALAAGAIGICVLAFGMRHDIGERMGLPHELGQWLASIATGICAALAAAMLARADRPASWGLLPLPPLALWLASLGWGCLADVVRLGPIEGQLGTSWGCLRFTLLLGAPLTAALLLLLRHAGPVRPRPVLLLGALASAALCSAGLTLFHHLDAAVMVLLWHGGAALVLLGLAALFGDRLLLRAPGSG